MDFLCKIEGDFKFLVNFFFWSEFFERDFILYKIEGDYKGFLFKKINFMGIFCKFFCWRSLVNLDGNSFIKYKRENFTKDFLVKEYFHGNSF